MSKLFVVYVQKNNGVTELLKTGVELRETDQYDFHIFLN